MAEEVEDTIIAEVTDDQIISSAEVTEVTEETEEETVPTHAFPCPTCGMLFSESEVCDTHTAFCQIDDGQPADWTEDRIHLLIDCMDARYSRFVQMSPKERKHHWKRAGHIVAATPDEARLKWNQLTASYNRIRVALLQGRGRGADRWQFYDKMDNILGDRVTQRAEFVLSSMPLKSADDGSVQPSSGILFSPESEIEPSATPRLIDLMEERYARYNKMTARKRKAFWQEMAETLGITPEEARIRWNMLVGSYKRTKLNRALKMKRSGSGPKHKWRHFEQMERILGDRFKPPPTPLLVLNSRPIQPAPPLFSVPPLFTAVPAPQTAAAAAAPAQGQTPSSASAPAPDSTAAPRPGAVPAAPAATVLQIGADGILQAVPGTAAPVQQVTSTVLQAGTPQQQQADIDSFATKRKALFVEDYLRAKARREELRLQLEERRIRALERMVDLMEARGSC